jgi:hypothetical protein
MRGDFGGLALGLALTWDCFEEVGRFVKVFLAGYFVSLSSLTATGGMSTYSNEAMEKGLRITKDGVNLSFHKYKRIYGIYVLEDRKVGSGPRSKSVSIVRLDNEGRISYKEGKFEVVNP